jgi:hypothetical protein
MAKHLRIYVDADACPVKEEILAIRPLYPVDIFFIASYAHASESCDDHWIYVDSEPEAVDLYIVNHAEPGDIVVTADHGLASLLSGREVYVLSPKGKPFLEEDMDHTLFRRYLSAKQRRAGAHVKGPRKMSEQDRNRFSESLKRILSINEGKRL